GSAELALARFCSRYYHRGLGEVLAAGLPPRLRQVRRRRIEPPVPGPAGDGGFVAAHALNDAQRGTIDRVTEGFGRFHPVLLQGVTGSGKTEIYLHLIAE